jgi:hypothetical protein
VILLSAVAVLAMIWIFAACSPTRCARAIRGSFDEWVLSALRQDADKASSRDRDG